MLPIGTQVRHIGAKTIGTITGNFANSPVYQVVWHYHQRVPEHAWIARRWNQISIFFHESSLEEIGAVESLAQITPDGPKPPETD